MKKTFSFLNSKQILLILITGIISTTLYYTYVFFDAFKRQEEIKMEILAEAYIQFNKATDNEDISLLVKIIENNNSIPMIVTDSNNKILLDQNINHSKENREKVLLKKLKEMKETHLPIEINISKNQTQHIYYSNSEILNKLQFYPFALTVIFIFFLALMYFILNASSVSGKNKLWSGMAKETAHQIGTPLSSLLGWVEILRSENIDQSYVDEIQKDVEHLTIIANRFSKIGSEPVLKLNDASKIIDETISYFRARSSKNIIFSYNKQGIPVFAKLNEDLFGWVLENLIKNAIDAMQGKGDINIQLLNNQEGIQILITDTGKGISKKLQRKIFEPGYTTKERGWGLGLSLTQRIICKYHNGKVFVKQSQPQTGTTFQINIPT